MREKVLAALVAALGGAVLALVAEPEVVAACVRVLLEAVRFVSSWWFPG